MSIKKSWKADKSGGRDEGRAEGGRRGRRREGREDLDSTWTLTRTCPLPGLICGLGASSWMYSTSSGRPKSRANAAFILGTSAPAASKVITPRSSGLLVARLEVGYGARKSSVAAWARISCGKTSRSAPVAHDVRRPVLRGRLDRSLWLVSKRPSHGMKFVCLCAQPAFGLGDADFCYPPLNPCLRSSSCRFELSDFYCAGGSCHIRALTRAVRCSRIESSRVPLSCVRPTTRNHPVQISRSRSTQGTQYTALLGALAV